MTTVVASEVRISVIICLSSDADDDIYIDVSFTYDAKLRYL